MEKEIAYYKKLAREDPILLLIEPRGLKLDYDYQHFRFVVAKIDALIEKYERLIELRKDIQEAYFAADEYIKELNLEIECDANRWERIRSAEKSEWEFELNQLRDIKSDIEGAIALIESGDAMKMLEDYEAKQTGEDFR